MSAPSASTKGNRHGKKCTRPDGQASAINIALRDESGAAQRVWSPYLLLLVATLGWLLLTLGTFLKPLDTGPLVGHAMDLMN